MNKIEMGKQYKTRDGRPARVLCVDLNNERWQVAAIIEIDGQEVVSAFRWDGRALANGQDHQSDLVEVRPRIKRTVFINVYSNYCDLFSSHTGATKHRFQPALACVQVDIDVEEGHGL